MKIKNTLTKLSVIIASAMITLLQINVSAASFSAFSMPQNMGATLNSADFEQLPVIAPSGLSLYFASNRVGGQGGQDIYVSQRSTLSAAWGAPQNLGATVNSADGDSPAGISPDGREMFINSQRAGGQGAQDIWRMTRTDPNNDFGWSAPVNLGATINTGFMEQNPTYFVNPATGAGTLIFASDRIIGVGIKDFYQSTRNPDGTFNAPTIIAELNSEEDEPRATISGDGLEVFFSSRRLDGINNIFTSTRASVSAAWSPPVYVTGLNSDGSTTTHPNLSADGTTLYFLSDRPGELGNGDLHSAVRISVNRTATADFDGDGRSDFSVFRQSDGTWYILQSGTNSFRAQPFGTNGDKIVPGDYDGDGRTDFAVVRAVSNSSVWYVIRSSDNSFSGIQWGLATDKLVPADYDGDGRTDIAVYRNGTWYVLQSSNGQFAVQHFGASDDMPVPLANTQ